MDRKSLINLYIHKQLHASDIAKLYTCSENKVNYWLRKHRIPKRSISEAMYLKLNPQGDPFKYKRPETEEDLILFGLGIGLYWGEGNKRNKNSVKLGNTDPNLIIYFLKFLDKIFFIDKNKLRFGLQIFSDIKPEIAKKYWMRELKIKSSQFQKVIVTPARKPGTYKHKSEYGVLTVNFSNTKIKKILDRLIENPSVM